MSLSQELDKEIQASLHGKSNVIPFSYARVNDYVDIAKNTMYSVAGETGVGKSTIAVDAFLINPILWYLENKNENIKLSVIYLSMERKLYMTTSRIISRLIWMEQGLDIPPKKILGRKEGYKLTEEEYKLVQEYYKQIDEWEKDDLLITAENSKNPTGISIFLEEFAKRHGKVHHKDTKQERTFENTLEKPKTYEPNHPNHIVLVITDHIGILTPEQGNTKVKNTIDAFSKAMREARDVYGFSPVIIQQMNRNMSDIHRQKMGELKPKLSDISDSSSTSHDSDVVMMLHDPLRHNSEATEQGYQIKRFRDKWNRNYYRSLHIVKNTFESSDISFSMALHPVYGCLKTLPKKDEITESIYEDVTSGRYFTQQESIEPNRKPFKWGQSEK